MKHYFSLIKFSHTIFAMPFALIGFFLAVNQGLQFDWLNLIYVILCMLFARSAAMGFNRYLDRDIDKANKRTSEIREIPNGTITPKNALIFVIINTFLFIITTSYINNICFFLSPIAILIILGYSYTKRFTSLCHIFLGLGLSLSPIGAFLTVKSEFEVLPVLFSLIVLFWVSGFDIIYSLQDKEFDKKFNLHSIPVLFGLKKAIKISIFFHFIVFTLLIITGILGEFKILYWIGSSIFTFLLFFQHTQIKATDLNKINLAFFKTNGIASIIFGCFVILDLIT